MASSPCISWLQTLFPCPALPDTHNRTSCPAFCLFPSITSLFFRLPDKYGLADGDLAASEKLCDITLWHFCSSSTVSSGLKRMGSSCSFSWLYYLATHFLHSIIWASNISTSQESEQPPRKLPREDYAEERNLRMSVCKNVFPFRCTRFKRLLWLSIPNTYT